MKKTLMKFKGWSVCESDERDRLDGRNDVYAEHDACSSPEHTTSGASWSWEFYDKVRKHGYEGCWECEAKVPAKVVALVVLYNWGIKGGYK